MANRKLGRSHVRFVAYFGICYLLLRTSFKRVRTVKTPKITRLLETALYLDDVGQGVRFYQELFEFPLLSGAAQPEATFAALELPGEPVLLFFKRGANAQPLETGDGIIPPHGGERRFHLAFPTSASL